MAAGPRSALSVTTRTAAGAPGASVALSPDIVQLPSAAVDPRTGRPAVAWAGSDGIWLATGP